VRHDAAVDSLARQRAAAVAVWKADAATRVRGDWTDLGGLCLHTTGIAVAHWNGAKLVTRAGMACLDEAGAWFADRGMPWGLLVPAELDHDHGLSLITEQPVMLRDLEDLDPVPDLQLRWDCAGDAAAVQSQAFGDALDLTTEFVLPKVTNPASAVVVAYDGGLPVATATVFCVEGVAAVFGVGTVEAARRRGLGAALTLAVLHEGRRRGCDLAYLNPSPLGYGVYARLGFTDAPPWRVYQPPG
jgi:GNAT superfamily N-acetyltransferase